MFLQLRVSRDGARLRGAPDQAAAGGRGAHGADGPSGPHRVRRERATCRRADLVPSPWRVLTVSPTWSPQLPDTKELMQTLREAAPANREKVTGADLNWKRTHRLHELPHAFGLAFVAAPAAATGSELSWA